MPKKILVVDDEPDSVDFVSSILEENGYDYISAYDGVEGLELVRKEKPDLILLDLIMPEKSGIHTSDWALRAALKFSTPRPSALDVMPFRPSSSPFSTLLSLPCPVSGLRPVRAYAPEASLCSFFHPPFQLL